MYILYFCLASVVNVNYVFSRKSHLRFRPHCTYNTKEPSVLEAYTRGKNSRYKKLRPTLGGIAKVDPLRWRPWI